eukprot:GILK01012301.1.p1 GENE.GILK01012301.1~~GILK01012301.1.p1  ORF type:complete len:282 (+),score=48.94 GILK01012301.1:43-846(+)
MSDVKVHDDELKFLLRELRQHLTQLQAASGSLKTLKLQECDSLVSQVRICKETYGLEVAGLGHDRQLWQKKLDDSLQTFELLMHEFTALRLHTRKEDLYAGRTVNSSVAKEQQSSAKMIEMGDMMQKKTKESLLRSKEMIASSEQVGAATANKLEAQTDQISHVHGQVVQIESNLQRADRLIKAFLLRARKDRFIMSMMFCICVAIACIVLFKSITKTSLVSGPDILPNSRKPVFPTPTPTPKPSPTPTPKPKLSISKMQSRQAVRS